MKTILVPTDFSKNAYAALHYATQLFKTETCSFIIFHSFESQVSTLTSRVDIGKTEDVVDKLYTSSEVKCEEVKHQIILDASNPNHNFKIIVSSLTLHRAVNKLIEKEEVDFVVMSSKGQTGASSVLMGSNTLGLVKKIKKAPLLVVPQDYDFNQIMNIAFATGFKRRYLSEEMTPLLEIASISQASIKVLHIHEEEKLKAEQRENFHELFELLHDAKPEAGWLSENKDRYDALTTYLHKGDVQLLAMVYYKHNFFTGLFREALIKKMAKNLSIPFLILPTLN